MDSCNKGGLFMEFYYEKFKELRKDSGINSKEVCNVLDISRTTLWKWENNKAVPSADFIRMLAKILKVSVNKISSLPIEPEYEHVNYVNAVESCNSLLDRDSFNLKNEQFKKSVANILSLQEELDQTSLILNALFNEMSSIFYIKDINLKYIAANKKFLQNLSLHSSFRVYGKSDSDFFPVKEAKENSELDKMVIQKGNSHYNEGYIFGSRKKKWGSIEKHPIYNDAGKITGLICTCKDITEQKLAEVENKRLLSEKNILFTAVNSLDRTVVIVYERTQKGTPIYKFVSNNIEKILGYTKEYLIKNNMMIANIIHEDDRQKLIKHFLDKNVDYFASKAKVLKIDGTYIWVDAKVQKRIEENGNISMLSILTI